MSEPTPMKVGTRVVVLSPDWLRGQTGIVVKKSPRDVLDCCVAFPDREDAMCFHWADLAAVRDKADAAMEETG